MALYKVKIHTERLATGSNGKAAALAVLKDLEVDLKFRECPAIEMSEVSRDERVSSNKAP